MRGAVIPTSSFKVFLAPNHRDVAYSSTLRGLIGRIGTENSLQFICFMLIIYEVKKREIKPASWGCFANCCWRYATGSNGEI